VTIDGAGVDLFYNATDNRLQSVAGAIAANYVNGATSLGLTYNNANRLVAIQSSGSVLATYAINALGQRISKTVGGITTLFIYDELGHLLGEYDSNGNLIQETVWLEDIPVATLRPTGNPTSIGIYYVHADHLGSPRAVTRSTDNVIMWRWDNLDPFGANLPNENPAGQGEFKYNLRFPGQYYDAEIGTHYNYHRDYNPAVGRYEQSDPIGSRGGISTYAYVEADPISGADPKGLARRDPRPRGPGCGPGYGTGIPDNPFIVLKFRQCCVDHDNCYDDCQNQPTKEQCDNTFCGCLIAECNKNPATADVCLGVAGIYCFAAVSGGNITRQCGCAPRNS